MASVAYAVPPFAIPSPKIDSRPVDLWARIPQRLNAEDGLTKCERLVLFTITRVTQLAKWAGRISFPDLAKYSGVSERAAKDAVRTLKEKRRIEVDRGGGRAVNTYRLAVSFAGRKPVLAAMENCTAGVQNEQDSHIRNARTSEDHHHQEDKIVEVKRSNTTFTFLGAPPPEKPCSEERAQSPVQSQTAAEPPQPAAKVVTLTKTELPPRECESDRQELVMRYQKRFGVLPGVDVLDDVESHCVARNLTMRTFLERIWQHWTTSTPRNPPAFMRWFAQKLPRYSPQLEFAYARTTEIPKRCDCNRGVLPDGNACHCDTGQSLLRARARRERELAEKLTKQNTCQPS